MSCTLVVGGAGRRKRAAGEEEEDGQRLLVGSEGEEDSDSEIIQEYDEESGGSSEEDDTEEDDDGSSDDDEDNDEDKLENRTQLKTAAAVQEYGNEEEDSSDEEDLRSTVGNIPLHWYDSYTHIGYDQDGKKIVRPVRGDKLDEFLKRIDDPEFWHTVFDPTTGQSVILSPSDTELIKKLQSSLTPSSSHDPNPEWVEWFSSITMDTPVRGIPLSKTSFLPSRHDKKTVSKFVHAIKMGWMKMEGEEKKVEEKKFYNLWSQDNEENKSARIDNLPPPKPRLPTTAESYNPPAEYLLDEQELDYWKKLDEEPWKRRYNFVPSKYDNLRSVPSYNNYIKERFERCLDLYLCPRGKRMRLTLRAEDLVPTLPSPKELQPFPTTEALVYKTETPSMVRCLSLEPVFGQYFVSGSEDGGVRVWELSTARLLSTFNFPSPIKSLEWCPNKSITLIAVATEQELYIINPSVGDKLVVEKTDLLLKEAPEQQESAAGDLGDKIGGLVKWEGADDEMWGRGIRIVIKHYKPVGQVTFHPRGDYFSTLCPTGQNRSVFIHQLSTRKSQLPLSKSKGLVQYVQFHPQRALFFVATQRHIRIYDLLKQVMIKKLVSGAKWISCMAIHPAGDNLLVGTYDKKTIWFDLDLSTKPYITLRHHGNAVRSVAYHKRYPLFASGSDDCNVIVSHGMVYNDLLQNPLLVPVKKLRGHSKSNDYGVTKILFHNQQPWLISSGADGTVRLYC